VDDIVVAEKFVKNNAIYNDIKTINIFTISK
jgi:hypothetical protein